MQLKKKSVYISPNKMSEVIPLLGESLLLYDEIAMDISVKGFFEVLSATIDVETMSNLLDQRILQFTYYSNFPVIAKQTSKTSNSLVLLNLNDSDIPAVNYDEIRETLKTRYPKVLINKILSSLKNIEIDTTLLLENCYTDLNNTVFVKDIFTYVKEYFDLPDFIVEVDGVGCLFQPTSKEEKLPKRVYDFATYGLHLIAETNYRMALLRLFDEVSCEEEFESFFVNKMRYAYRSNDYKHSTESLLELCEIHNFPNIKELISSNLLTIEDILNLRNGEGRILRVWLDSIKEKCVKESIQFSKEYARFLTKDRFNLPLPARTVVFGMLQGLATIKPQASLPLAIANEYIVPKLVEGWEPKYFIDKARKLSIQREKAII